MSERYETFAMSWRGRALTVRWARQWGSENFPISHLEVRSDDGQPLPITETGYRSHFVGAESVEAWGCPTDYVRAWLDHEADTDAWREHEAASRQLSLF